jgi:protein KTI12
MLLVLTGLPCSGKSTVARRLAEIARAEGVEARVVAGEEEGSAGGGGAAGAPVAPSLGVGARDAAYGDPSAEKNARSAFKSAVERGLSARALTVADGMNGIKGYRYELWCAARAVGGRAAVVHVDAAARPGGGGGGGGGGAAGGASATAAPSAWGPRAWNAARLARGEDGYGPAVFDDLCGRYERPDSRNRWDAPLFTVRWPEAGAGEAAEAASAAEAAVRSPEVDAVLRAALFAVTGGKAGAPVAAAAVAGAAAAAEGGGPGAQQHSEAAAQQRAAALASGGLVAGLRSGGRGEQLRAGISTARPALAETNTLYAIDRECQVRAPERRERGRQGTQRPRRSSRAAPSRALSLTHTPNNRNKKTPPQQQQEVVNLILEAQAAAGAGAAPGVVDLSPPPSSSSAVQAPPSRPPLQLRLPATDGGVPVAELRAHKRAFVRLATRREYGRLEEPSAARRLFVEYLQRELEGR